jgi:DNA polymerase III subunit delta'
MFKWHYEIFQKLHERGARTPHALLLYGPEGTGIAEFAAFWAQSLLCENPAQDGKACGQCCACNWFTHGNHPDFRLLQPESFAEAEEESSLESVKARKSDQIRIDQIRALQGFLAIGTHRSRGRVVLLYPADTMNPATQNALLKHLEEPLENTFFMLVTSHPHRLLPTVRSRCQMLSLPKPNSDLAKEWLAEQGLPDTEHLLLLAGGSPLLAVDLAGRAEPIARLLDRLTHDTGMDPLAVAAECQDMEPVEVVAALYRWCYDMLASRLAGQVRYHPGRKAAIHELASRCKPERIAAYLRLLAQSRALAQHPLNTRLFFEDLFLRYGDLAERATTDVAP